MENTAIALSEVISVQEMTNFIQSGMTYDQISTVVAVFVLYNLLTRLSIKIASLFIFLF